MPRNRNGTDGYPLEWTIQDDYDTACKRLGKPLVPLLLQFHLGNQNGGKTFMTKGIPDTLTYYIPRGTREARRLWIEFKRHNGKLSKEQQAVIATLIAMGEDVLVCYSAAEAIDALTERLGLVNRRRKV